MTGTLLVIIGMGLCAALIERRSIKRHFVPKSNYITGNPRIYWVQAGNQRVADQQFPSFAYSQEVTSYITSYLVSNPDSVTVLWIGSPIAHKIAILFSIIGFALQFVGLRGLHGSITLYQLACTLIMTAIRTSLRGRRLPPDANRLGVLESESGRCELDWQALKLVQAELVYGGMCKNEKTNRKDWKET